MNKPIVFFSLVVSIILINGGISTKTQVDNLRKGYAQLKCINSVMREEIKNKKLLAKRVPVYLSTEYGVVMNQVKVLESYSGTSMDVQLEDKSDADDISTQYVDTAYKGVKGLRIRIVVDKFSKETDMGAVLDDIHLLEENTDFMATEISKDNNNLIVKGEVYGI